MKYSLKTLIDQIGPGHMPSTAYDTSWAARLLGIDAALGHGALEWISEHQLPDGSWGAEVPFYFHDRVICTLAAMIALTYSGRRQTDQKQIFRGLEALERIVSGATQGLRSDPNGVTVGFEMIVPTLIADAEKLGIIKGVGDSILGRLAQLRAKKLASIQGRMINKNLTAAFSAEMAGMDGQHMLDVDHLLEANGSVAHSPSASAYFALYVKKHEPATMDYLHRVVSPDGGLPNVAPFDVFETAWALWNLSSIPGFKMIENLKPHLEFLEKALEPKGGVGFAAEYSVRDSDDTGLVLDTLLRYGRESNIECLVAYEEPSYFRCYELEANPSLSANIHVLGALRQAGFDRQHPSVQKILDFLQQAKGDNPYWMDKWHSSPYYPTAHAIMACAGYANDLVEESVQWLLSSQNPEGAWGISVPTVEETAYAIQALRMWNEVSAPVATGSLKSGAQWLEDHFEDPYPPLWIGKCLYAPSLVIRSAAISALAGVN